eukprot:scaffold27882_cov122-Isochrysis_galbana.AAC.3
MQLSQGLAHHRTPVAFLERLVEGGDAAALDVEAVGVRGSDWDVEVLSKLRHFVHDVLGDGEDVVRDVDSVAMGVDLLRAHEGWDF